MTRFLSRILIAVAIIAISSSCRNASERDSMQRLKDTIQKKGNYEQELLNRISILRNQLHASIDNNSKWTAANRLYQEFLTYDIDSALVYSDLMTELADTPECKMIAINSRVSCLCALRMYSSAEKLLSSIDTTGFNDSQRLSYYNAHISLYTSLGNEFDTDPARAKDNLSHRYAYQKKLSLLPTLSVRDRKYLMGKQLMIEERFDEALDSLHAVLEMDQDISARLHTTYAIANCYNAKGDRGNYKKWLAETAIYDLKRPNRQYRSLYDLALCLYRDGNYAKAGEYIQMALMDATSCKHDTRIINAAEAQTIINAAREENSRDKRYLLLTFSILMLVAFVIISMALAKVNRQRKRLKNLMRRTKELNNELSKKNATISEANLLKEKYMFKYMFLSANFIKEMDEYRKSLRHIYKENGPEALVTKLREPEYIYMQYKAFYRHFDEIFLGIFPDFPDKVNGLLKEGKQICLKHKGVMSTELRILAVIRLGMTESRKIAEFLNTSVNTVYTYRTKMRYDSTIGPEEFENRIKEIDYFKI